MRARGCRFLSFTTRKGSRMFRKAKINKTENLGLKTLRAFLDRNRKISACAQRQNREALSLAFDNTFKRIKREQFSYPNVGRLQ